MQFSKHLFFFYNLWTFEVFEVFKFFFGIFLELKRKYKIAKQCVCLTIPHSVQ